MTVDGWAETYASWAQWWERRETVAQTCAELRTERLVPVVLGPIRRARAHAGPWDVYARPREKSRRWRR